MNGQPPARQVANACTEDVRPAFSRALRWHRYTPTTPDIDSGVIEAAKELPPRERPTAVAGGATSA